MQNSNDHLKPFIVSCLKAYLMWFIFSLSMHFLVVAKFILGGASSRATTFRGWNSLSQHLCEIPDLPNIKTQLKTHLFTPCPCYWNVYACGLRSCDCNQFVPHFVVFVFYLHCCVVLSFFFLYCFSSKCFLSCKARCPCVSERHNTTFLLKKQS